MSSPTYSRPSNNSSGATKRESLYVAPERGNALTEAMFGVYPASKDVKYIEMAYADVYKPDKVKANPDAWWRVFFKGAETPLHVTCYGLNTQRYRHHDPVIFVFEPTRPTDLIDLWDLRLEPHPVLPIPVGWFEALSDDVYGFSRPSIGRLWATRTA